jgi:hypothetical protein
MAENVSMIGYTRVSKADGRQVHDLQRDALTGGKRRENTQCGF